MSIFAASLDNPLATQDQRELDARAIRIGEENRYPLLRQAASLAYRLARLQFTSEEAAQRLDNVLDELIFSSIQKAVNADAFHPKVYWVNNPSRYWFGMNVPGGRYGYDNPDTMYRIIPIDPASKYVITGKRDLNVKRAVDISFSLISDVNAQWSVAYLDGDDLVVNNDGSYTITIDKEAAGARTNHIQASGNAVQLYVRHTLGHWLDEKPDFLSVERMDDGTEHEPLTDSKIAFQAGLILGASTFFYGIGSLGIKTMARPVNTLSAPQQSATLGTLVSQAHSCGNFKITEQQALIVTVGLGGAKYFILPVSDPWMLTVDAAKHQCSLNNYQSISNPDGSFSFVISIKDPGIWNWVSTVGLKESTAFLRWQDFPGGKIDPDNEPSVKVELVDFDQLKELLPPTTRYVTAAERAEQLRLREEGYNKRLQTGIVQEEGIAHSTR